MTPDGLENLCTLEVCLPYAEEHYAAIFALALLFSSEPPTVGVCKLINSVPDERKRLKWFAEASGLCKRKHGPTDLRKFVDFYGEKWKIKDCGLTNNQRAMLMRHITRYVTFYLAVGKWFNAFFLSTVVVVVTCRLWSKLIDRF